MTKKKTTTNKNKIYSNWHLANLYMWEAWFGEKMDPTVDAV